MQIRAFIVLLLFAVAAYASFGAAPCNEDFGCHFVTWGLLIGAAAGVPLSGAAFIALHFIFRHPKRDRIFQVVQGAILGMVAYEVAALCGALSGSMGWGPMLGLAVAWIMCAAGFVRHVRSDPN